MVSYLCRLTCIAAPKMQDTETQKGVYYGDELDSAKFLIQDADQTCLLMKQPGDAYESSQSGDRLFSMDISSVHKVSPTIGISPRLAFERNSDSTETEVLDKHNEQDILSRQGSRKSQRSHWTRNSAEVKEGWEHEKCQSTPYSTPGTTPEHTPKDTPRSAKHLQLDLEPNLEQSGSLENFRYPHTPRHSGRGRRKPPASPLPHPLSRVRPPLRAQRTLEDQLRQEVQNCALEHRANTSGKKDNGTCDPKILLIVGIIVGGMFIILGGILIGLSLQSNLKFNAGSNPGKALLVIGLCMVIAVALFLFMKYKQTNKLANQAERRPSENQCFENDQHIEMAVNPRHSHNIH